MPVTFPWEYEEDIETLPSPESGVRPVPGTPTQVTLPPSYQWHDDLPGLENELVGPFGHGYEYAPNPQLVPPPVSRRVPLGQAEMPFDFEAGLVPFSRVAPTGKDFENMFRVFSASSPDLTEEEAQTLSEAPVVPGPTAKVLGGASEGVFGAAEALTSPLAIAAVLAPEEAAPLVSAYFAGEGLRQTPAAAENLAQAITSGDPEAITKAGVDVAGLGLMTVGGGLHGVRPRRITMPESMKALAETEGGVERAQTQGPKEEDVLATKPGEAPSLPATLPENAIQQEANPVLRDVPKQSGERPGQVSGQEVPQQGAPGNIPPGDASSTPPAETPWAGEVPLAQEHFATAEGAAKPEVANLSKSPYKNPQGDPMGTTYRATPEDWSAWQEVQKDLKKALTEGKDASDPEVTKIWTENERIKNKYGGMPPEPPKAAGTEGAPRAMPQAERDRLLSMKVDLFSTDRRGTQQYNEALIKGEPTTRNQVSLAEVVGDKPVFHETSLADAMSIYHDLRKWTVKSSWPNFIVSDNIDLALGQGGKGVTIEMDPRRLNGTIREKPGTSAETGREFSIAKSVSGSPTAVIFSNRRQVEAFKKRFPNSLDYDAATRADRGIVAGEGIRVPVKRKPPTEGAPRAMAQIKDEAPKATELLRAEPGKVAEGEPLDYKAISDVDAEGYRVADTQKLAQALESGKIKGHDTEATETLKKLLEPSEKHPLKSIRIIDLAPEDLKAITGKDVAYRGRFVLEKETPSATVEVLTRDQNNKAISNAEFVQTLIHELTHNAITSKIDQASPELKAELKSTLDHAGQLAKGTALDGHNAWTNEHEFLAEMKSDPAIQKFLRENLAPGETGPVTLKKSVWGRMLETFRKLIGWPEKVGGKDAVTLLDKALRISDELEGIKREPKAAREEMAPPEERFSPAEPTPEEERKFDAQQLGIVHPSFRPVMEMIQGVPGALKDAASQLAGKSAPKTSNRSAASGNALITYASSKISAPLVAKSMATDVLGEHHNDPVFGQKLGAVLVEDRLLAIKDAFTKAGDQEAADKVNTLIGKADSPFATEADFQAALADPEIQAAIARHKATVQPAARSAHTVAGGKLAGAGLNTGAFVNLKAIFEGNEEALLRGGGRGNLQNPLRRPSKFSKQATGTAENYETDYRTLAQRMIEGNFEDSAKRKMYAQLVRDGLAVLADPSAAQPEINGKPAVKFQIERKGVPAGEGKARTYVKNLWVDPAIAGEVRQALDVDGRVQKAALVQMANVLNKIQLAGPTDAVWHTANMISSIAGSQGGRTLLVDLARKLPGVNIADALGRTTASAIRVLRDAPDIQRQLAELSNIGALRQQVPGTGLGKYTHNLITLVDRAGRLVRDDMYKNLVDRGLVTDTPVARREWVNQMGQYNPRLMGQFQRFFKEAGFSPFIVAGRNFNRMAIRRLTMSPGIEAASPKAAAQMRAVEFLGTAATLFAIPALVNQFITGSPSGRPGTKVGQIDTGKDDKEGKHIVIDPAQWTGHRRGLRISGAQAVLEGMRNRDTKGRITKQAVDDIWAGLIHPWTGPAVTAASVAKTGHAPSGYKESVNPKDYGENLKAAGEQLNPVLKGVFKAWEQPKESDRPASIAKEVGKSLAGAVGVKAAPAISAQGQLAGAHRRWLENNEDPKVRADFKRHEQEEFVSQYKDLDKALHAKDEVAAAKAIQELKPLVRRDAIFKRMQPTVGEGLNEELKPLFQESGALESKFVRTLSPEDRALYRKALKERQEEWRLFLKVWRQQPASAPATAP